jgi:hypothetical protein
MNVRVPGSGQIQDEQPPEHWSHVHRDDMKPHAHPWSFECPHLDVPGSIIAQHAAHFATGPNLSGVTAQASGEDAAGVARIAEAGRRAYDGYEEAQADDEPSMMWLRIGLDASKIPPHTQEILREVVAPALERWITKNVEYGDTADVLGSKGQFADINRKVGKLKRLMWDDDVPAWAVSEPVEEVLQDLIGHCLLSIHYRRAGK